MQDLQKGLDHLIAKRMTDGKFQFEPTHKLHMRSSADPDLRSDAIKRRLVELQPLPPEVLADALQDRCHEDRPSRLTPFEQFLREGKR